jgi:hypothetical protein
MHAAVLADGNLFDRLHFAAHFGQLSRLLFVAAKGADEATQQIKTSSSAG